MSSSSRAATAGPLALIKILGGGGGRIVDRNAHVLADIPLAERQMMVAVAQAMNANMDAEDKKKKDQVVRTDVVMICALVMPKAKDERVFVDTITWPFKPG